MICEAKEITKFTNKDLSNDWLNAVYDLEPDAEEYKSNNTTYLKKWDNTLLDIYYKAPVGYYDQVSNNVILFTDAIFI
jgi:hypothetical protein